MQLRPFRAVHPALLPLLAVPILVVAIIGSLGTHTTPPMTSSPSARSTITIASFTYSPNPATAKVGDTITITNNDGTDHTVTADDHSFDTGGFSSGSRTITVTHPGTITFHCDIHNFMTGSIQVSG